MSGGARPYRRHTHAHERNGRGGGRKPCCQQRLCCQRCRRRATSWKRGRRTYGCPGTASLNSAKDTGTPTCNASPERAPHWHKTNHGTRQTKIVWGVRASQCRTPNAGARTRTLHSPLSCHARRGGCRARTHLPTCAVAAGLAPCSMFLELSSTFLGGCVNHFFLTGDVNGKPQQSAGTWGVGGRPAG